MHTASYEFLMKPKESAGCHQTLSARVESGDETGGGGGHLCSAVDEVLSVLYYCLLYTRVSLYQNYTFSTMAPVVIIYNYYVTGNV